MADHYEVVRNAPGFGSRLSNSIKGVLAGVALIFISFGLLWWGERRQNLAEFVKNGTLILSTQTATVAPGTLVKTTGRLRSDETINDDKYLNPGPQKFLELKRDVEMYAWKEDKKTKERGDKKEVTTYDYRKEWTRMPPDSSRFYDAAGHVNPGMSDDAASFQVKTASVGALTFEASSADFHGTTKLEITDSLLKKDETNKRQLGGGAVYVPNETIGFHDAVSTPAVGDLRLTYSYFPADVDGSVVGEWDGQKIVPHRYRTTETYLGAYAGSLEKFESTLQSEHTLVTWLIRILTLGMLWAGLNMILGPVLTVMDSIPIVGGAGRFVISLFTGAVAFVLWLLTLLLANVWLALLIVGISLVGLLIYGKISKKPAATPA